MSSADELSAGEKRRLSRLAHDLLAWARENGREFPWRSRAAGTYEKIAVEVLLQRTTASAVAGFYEAFFARFPGWDQLAAAPTESLEEFLKPLGLWRRRAASLIGLARYARDNSGDFPADPADHAAIPAVGQYVSNAILMFQHGHSAPLIDANMARVIERFLRPRRLVDIRHDPWLQEAARWLVRGRGPEATNWAVLDFAAVVCKARVPICPSCPVRSRCSFYRRNSRAPRGADLSTARG